MYNKIFFILTAILISSYNLSFAQKVKIDMSPFENSTQHWYNFFSASSVIHPLPGNPQHDEYEIEAIADNILLFQRNNGGWPKNYDMQAKLTDDQKIKLLAVKNDLSTTFDNATTHPQVAYLAKAYTITKKEKYKDAFLRGLDFILSAQYANGGWPQYYPNLPSNSEYSKRITYNDGAFIGIMNTLKSIVDYDTSYSFLDKVRREKVKIAFNKGLDCILKTQIIEDGVKKVWCQQHDEVTFQPAWGRTFEPPSLGNDESGSIVVFLMSIENPDKQIISAIQGAIKWFDDSKILNTRCIDDPTAPKYVSKYRVHNYDRRIVYDLNAPPVWTRFSELKTGIPIFCDRSGEILYNMSDIGRERRSGYRWYTYSPREALDKYHQWQKKWAPEENVLVK
ncbi:MAG: pectate lyase [Bacteroidales bacterium]|nr:pectate lyase [Bacteroidales bacterium]